MALAATLSTGKSFDTLFASLRHVHAVKQLKNSSPAEAGEFLYGTYQTFAKQMWLGAQTAK